MTELRAAPTLRPDYLQKAEKGECEMAARIKLGLWVRLKVLQGEKTSMQILLVNDVRNDLYINIYISVLSWLSKITNRIIEAMNDTKVDQFRGQC